MFIPWGFLGAALALLCLAATPASATEVEGCPGLVASGPSLLRQARLSGAPDPSFLRQASLPGAPGVLLSALRHRAALSTGEGPGDPSAAVPAAFAEGQVGLTFVGHATFIVASPKGVRIATDYSDATRPTDPPDVATMNKAHSTHFSHRPDPRIKHVLRGWNPAGGPAYHDLQVEDVRIRNVSTNIRDWGGGTEFDGNSIFVFETATLCIAHLGHLHHTLTPEHLKKLGRIDVLLVPVDGGYTLETFDMMEVLKAINAPLMVPMHFFGPSTLQRFLASARQHFPVEFSPQASITLSRETLPRSPKILVLPGH